MPKTQLEKRIERLTKELKNATAQKQGQARKERNGQLIAFGIFLEAHYKRLSIEEEKKTIRTLVKELLTGRNKERALKGLDRIDKVHV